MKLGPVLFCVLDPPLLSTVPRHHAQLLLKGRLQTLQIVGTFRCRIPKLGSPVGQQLLEPGGVLCNTLLA
ncbi:unnamed protein product [Linum trigynum]|uniref:Secreted protein n=1 Tax=Linum trigynum TaxID=586398 RepID=A0AAV2D9P9_9ROSI